MANNSLPVSYTSAHLDRDKSRLYKRVDKNGPLHPVLQTQCWVWTGPIRVDDGYGIIYFQGKTTRVHRLSYLFAYGAWPKNLCCHHCDNRRCVRPDHLFDGTALDNNRDRQAKVKQGLKPDGVYPLKECKRGHAFTPENTRTFIRNGISERRCAACARLRSRNYYYRVKTA